MNEWRGRWALVTGASSGLGADFAELLAARGCHLVLVARRRDRLESLAERLSGEHGIRTRVIEQDLLADEAVSRLADSLEDTPVDILVNNAGFGLHGPFLRQDWHATEAMLRLDMLVLSELTHRFGGAMADRGLGWILNLSSIGAFQPSPTYAAYSAAKGYVLDLSYALRRELGPSGVTVTVLSPGVTRTEFLEVAGQSPSLYQRLIMKNSRPVARAGLRALGRGRAGIVPGLVNKLTVLTMRFLPRTWQAAVAHWAMRY